MKTDPIVSEVRTIRRQILEAHGGDFRKMARTAIERQNTSNRPIIPATQTSVSGGGKKEFQQFSLPH